MDRNHYIRRKMYTGASRWYRLRHSLKSPRVRLWIGIVVGFGALIFYMVFLFGMPSISQIETSFKESSIIYDKDGGQLYTFYGDENREYVNYTQISPKVVNALVAMEDQRFFSNIGFDVFGIIRSGITCAMGGACGGGSSLSQQLIKNTLLANEKFLLRRKIQEIFLALQLNIRFDKTKILELYLNKISFGSNSFGVQQASQRFFGKNASEVNVMEAAVLASLPKTPTGYNPYSKRDRLMGYAYYLGKKGDTEAETIVTNESNAELFKAFKTAFSGLQFTTERGFTKVCGLAPFVGKDPFEKKLGDECETVAKKDLMEFLNSLQLESTFTVEKIATTVTLEYQAGRKDRVLMRMYEDEYINDGEYKDALFAGLDYVFQDPKESIRYPHFVFYVKDYLVDKYGEDFFQKGGWKIYTTIDPKLQDKAQEIIDSYAQTTFKNYGINNGALVTLDTKTRNVVAMVGSQDYNNKEIDGEVNITTSLKQPGSSMKPFIYARAFERNNLSTDTPIFDVDMNFGTWNPKNFDGKFYGPMTIRTALNASRNIPAIKMYYLATQNSGDDPMAGENDLVEYLRNAGMETIEHRPASNAYGPPIVLGSAEVKPLDFAASYAAMANNGEYIKPNPILKIVDPEGNEISQDPPASRQAMLPAAAYMITNILSDSPSRPLGWNNFLALAGNRRAAVKTGTSSKKVRENTYPRDLWTMGYTPQYTTAVWTGNTNGKSASARASGMESSALIWKKFMDFAHEKLPKEDFVRPDDVEGSERFLYINGKKPEILSSFDPEKIKVDSLCEGLVDDRTPTEAIQPAVLIDSAFPIEDSYPAWREAVDAWIGSDEARAYLAEKLELPQDVFSVVTKKPEAICERPDSSAPQFTSSLTDGIELFAGSYPITIDFHADNPLREVKVLVNDIEQKSVAISDQKDGSVKLDFNLIASDGNDQTVTVRVIDTFGYSSSRNYRVKLLGKDVIEPVIMPDNPTAFTVISGQKVKISGTISDQSDVSKIQIIVDDQIYGTLQGVKKYSVILSTPSELGKGKHTISIQVTDFQKNITTMNHIVTVE